MSATELKPFRTSSLRWTIGLLATVLFAGILCAQENPLNTSDGDSEFSMKNYLPPDASNRYEDGSTERFSKDISYYSWAPQKQIDCKKDGIFTSLKEFDYFSKDGFYAVAFESKNSGDIILAFRGTDNIASTIQDATPEGIGYTAYKKYFPEVSNWVSLIQKEKKNRKLILTGHSLGGALAQLFAIGLTEQHLSVEKLETFNSPGISSKVIKSSFQTEYCPTVIHHIQAGDIVSMAGEAFVPGTNYIYYYYPGISFILKHLVPMTVYHIGSLYLPYGTTRVSIQSEYFSDRNFLYSQKADKGYYDYIYHGKVFMIADKVPILDALHRRGTTEDARKELGPYIKWILEFFKTNPDDSLNGSLHLDSSNIRSNSITINLSSANESSYSIVCYHMNDSEINPLEVVCTKEIILNEKTVGSVIFENLSPESDYLFAASAQGKEGENDILADYGLILASTREIEKIESLDAKLVTDTSMGISWQYPLELGDALVGGVQYRKEGDQEWSLPSEAVGVTETQQLLTGLLPETSYEIGVVFYSREGITRLESDVIKVTTKQFPDIRYSFENKDLIIFFDGELYESLDAKSWTPVEIPNDSEGIYHVPFLQDQKRYYTVVHPF